MRPKLSIPAQIKDMRDAGIIFDIVTEADARRYLETYTYYFRIKAYAKNYEKYISTDKQGQYINLDFAYLLDLSEIDALFRDLIMKMILSLEHFLRVKLLSDFNMTQEDGYEIIQELFSMQPELKSKIEEEKSNTSTSNDLIAKYKDDWAIWNIVEVISLGSFAELYALFYNRNGFGDSHLKMIHPIRMLRNAVAHNNCLLNRLRPPYSRSIPPNYDLRNELTNRAKISRKSIDNKLVHPVIHDFSVLLFVYSRIVPASVQEQMNIELSDLFNDRMLRNKDFYKGNSTIESSYCFVKKVIDYYCG